MGDLHAAVPDSDAAPEAWLVLTGPAGAIDATVVAETGAVLDGLGIAAAPEVLAPDTAIQIPLAASRPNPVEALRMALRDRPVDVNRVSAAGRRKTLLLADMDSTIVDAETLDELAAHAGLYDEIAAVTRRAMNGELDFETALRERVGKLAGLPEAAIDDTLSKLALIPGARTLVATMKANGAYCALVSGGFEPFTRRVREMVGFDEDRSNRLEIADGRLTGRVLEPILGREAKLATLTQLLATHGLEPQAAVTVGDGANDLAMLAAAGLGVAFRAKPAVAAEAAVRLDHTDLTGLLFLQGYRAGEFRAGEFRAGDTQAGEFGAPA